MKILSFIIPSYNCQQYLDKCLTSMLAEEVLEELDIIIVNDGSTDSTQAVAEKYCRQYPGSVRLIDQENLGHGGALNTGCAAAVGRYLKVIDADDWVETAALEPFVAFLRECESDVVLTHHYTVNIANGEVKRWKSYPPQFGEAYSFGEIVRQWKDFERSLTFHGITYKTEFYHRMAVQLSEHVFYEDHEFATIPCCYAQTVAPVDLFIYHYRIGDVEQSVSEANQLRRLGHTETVLKRLIREYHTLTLPRDAPGREYYCRKAQGLLLSYITTVMLVEKDKAKGRKMGQSMMALFRQEMPRAYELAKKQYHVFRGMNYLHVSKGMWDKMLHSPVYRFLRRAHDFH